MIIATSYEQFKYLPKNKGKDPKAVYKEWLFEEAKLLMMVDGYMLAFMMQNNPFSLGVVGIGQSTAGGSGEPIIIPPGPPAVKVTYFTPDANPPNPVNTGYYAPDEELLFRSYYVFVNP